MDKVVYVVYLGGTPIGVHKWPWMACNEAKERSIDGKSATVSVFNFGHSLEADDFQEESPTDPRCTLCSQGDPCADDWKPGPV